MTTPLYSQDLILLVMFGGIAGVAFFYPLPRYVLLCLKLSATLFVVKWVISLGDHAGGSSYLFIAAGVLVAAAAVFSRLIEPLIATLGALPLARIRILNLTLGCAFSYLFIAFIISSFDPVRKNLKETQVVHFFNFGGSLEAQAQKLVPKLSVPEKAAQGLLGGPAAIPMEGVDFQKLILKQSGELPLKKEAIRVFQTAPQVAPGALSPELNKHEDYLDLQKGGVTLPDLSPTQPSSP